jgi:hypothetical protein
MLRELNVGCLGALIVSVLMWAVLLTGLYLLIRAI